MEIRRVGHIGLYTRDLDAGIRWYREILGLELTGRTEGAAYLSCDATHHGLILYEGDPPEAHHFGFEVPASGRWSRRIGSFGVQAS